MWAGLPNVRRTDFARRFAEVLSTWRTEFGIWRTNCGGWYIDPFTVYLSSYFTFLQYKNVFLTQAVSSRASKATKWNRSNMKPVHLHSPALSKCTIPSSITLTHTQNSCTGGEYQTQPCRCGAFRLCRRRGKKCSAGRTLLCFMNSRHLYTGLA